MSVLPREFDCVSEVFEKKDYYSTEEVANQKLVCCYYVMNNGVVKGQHAMFERPNSCVMNHLKPLFIRVKVDNIGINKVFVDEGATVNLMPHYLLKRIGKYDTDLCPYNMMLSNYEGNTSHVLGVIQGDLLVGTLTRSTLFMVISSKAVYNLTLG